MTAEVQLQLAGNLDHLRLTWQAAETLLEQVPFQEDPVQTRYNLLLALQEALSNVLRHGYGGESFRAHIELRFQWNGESFRIELRDDAAAFDPTETVVAPEVHDGGQIPEGGYGIHIIRAVVDSLDYRREGKHNVLTLEKSLAPVRSEV